MIGQRTIEELKSSTLYGNLYKIVSEHGHKLIACRVRRRGDELWLIRNDRTTIYRTPDSAMKAVVGDFVFQDKDKMWAIWRAQMHIGVNE